MEPRELGPALLALACRYCGKGGGGGETGGKFGAAGETGYKASGVGETDSDGIETDSGGAETGGGGVEISFIY